MPHPPNDSRVQRNSTRRTDMGARFIQLLAASALLMTACATSYKPVGVSGGFEETQLAENVWRVRFRGNGYTSSSKVEDYAMLRAAELTITKGYSFFRLEDSRNASSTAYMTTPSTTTTSGTATTYGTQASYSATSTTTPGVTVPIRKAASSSIVVMYKDNPGDSQGMVYDANFVCTSVGQKYGLVCGDQH